MVITSVLRRHGSSGRLSPSPLPFPLVGGVDETCDAPHGVSFVSCLLSCFFHAWANRGHRCIPSVCRDASRSGPGRLSIHCFSFVSVASIVESIMFSPLRPAHPPELPYVLFAHDPRLLYFFPLSTHQSTHIISSAAIVADRRCRWGHSSCTSDTATTTLAAAAAPAIAPVTINGLNYLHYTRPTLLVGQQIPFVQCFTPSYIQVDVLSLSTKGSQEGYAKPRLHDEPYLMYTTRGYSRSNHSAIAW